MINLLPHFFNSGLSFGEFNTGTKGDKTQSKYINRREDTVYETEDGPRTSFDYYIDTEGYEEEYYEKFDGNKKCEFLLKMIKEYSGILTDKEIKVLSFLEKGLSQYEIADNLGVTHQAVSSLSLKIYDKIRAYFGSEKRAYQSSFSFLKW